MIDVHCHLNFKAFEKDCDEVIKRALNAGVSKIINVGTKIDSSQKAVELANNHENLYAIVGIHPHHADKVQNGWEVELEDLVLQSRISLRDTKNPKVVGIGECGMDFFSYKSNAVVDPKLQKEVFVKQIELAHKLKLPLQIHNRHAGKEILDVLKNHKSYFANPPGMFHCFSGNRDFLKEVLNLGFYVGFDGNITYKGKAPGEETELKELVRYAPLNRIVVETDSPYLTPVPHRGSRNEPSYAIIIGEFIAQTKGLLFEKVVRQTTVNADTIFRLN